MKSPTSSYPAKSKTGGTPYVPGNHNPTINSQTKRHPAPRLSDRGKGSK